jgi:hypothetical protein
MIKLVEGEGGAIDAPRRHLTSLYRPLKPRKKGAYLLYPPIAKGP